MRSLCLLLTLSLLLVSGCGQSASKADVAKYGVERFVADVLSFETTHALPESIAREFSPKRAEEHLNGVLLVYSESSRWIEGIYVDQSSVADWGGSGFEVEEWFSQVAWVRIKKRAGRTSQSTEPEPRASVSSVPGFSDIGFAAEARPPAPVGDFSRSPQ
jgi:hypothetical protein